MTIEDIQAICGKWKGVTQDIKWENHLCFNVGEKMFLVTAPDEVPISASFKVADEEFDEVSARPGCKPAPYMARYKWVWIDDINRIGKKEWTRLLTSSYEQVAAKLPAKKKKELGI